MSEVELKSEEGMQNISQSNEAKFNKILLEQSSQMLSLVAIANAHSKENEDLINKNKILVDDLTKIQSEKNDLQNLFNMQTLLFILLVLLLVWMYCH